MIKTDQLSLLDLTPEPELASLPLPVPAVDIQAHVNTPPEVAYWQAQADFYLRLMSKLASKAIEKPHLRHEISRLHALRQQALENSKNGCSS